jgi:hypothetical protein
MIKHFTTQLEAVDKAIAETIDQTPDPQAKRERLFSIGGAGDEYPTDGNPHGVLSDSAVEITFTPPTSLRTSAGPIIGQHPRCRSRLCHREYP